MTPGTTIHSHAEKDWVKRELREHGPDAVFSEKGMTLEQALAFVDDYPTEYLPVGRCDARDARGVCLGHEPPPHVSFPTDDEPETDDSIRLHVMADLDYYVSVGRGHRPPFDGFRACTSGARDHRVTFLVAALYKLGRGDLDGAVAAANAFIEEVDTRTPEVVAESVTEDEGDER